MHILEELRARVGVLEGELGRRMLVIAESDLNDPRLVRRGGEGGYALDAQWCDDLHHALWAALSGERAGYYGDFGPLAAVAAALTRGLVYEGGHSGFRRRRHGRPHTGVPGERLVACMQNHDQVGNRAVGDRPGATLGVEALMAAAATVLLGPATPLIFMGEEWGATTPWQYFTDHRDPRLAAAVRDGRRAEFAAFGWTPAEVPDPQDPATFERSRLRWDEPAREPHARLLAWHRDLLRLRREHPTLRRAPWDGDRGFAQTACEVDEAARTLVLRRGPISVAWNLGAGSARLRLAAAGGAPRVLVSSVPGWTPGGAVAAVPGGVTVVTASG
jgi:maltooligosyltrehalose trehalohydrolase